MKSGNFDFKKELVNIWFNEYWDNKGHIPIGDLDVINKSTCFIYYSSGIDEKAIDDKTLLDSLSKFPKEDFVNRQKFIEHYFAGREKIAMMKLSQQREAVKSEA